MFTSPMILQLCTYVTEIKYPQNHRARVCLYIIARYLCVFRQQLLSWHHTNYTRVPPLAIVLQQKLPLSI